MEEISSELLSHFEKTLKREMAKKVITKERIDEIIENSEFDVEIDALMHFLSENDIKIREDETKEIRIEIDDSSDETHDPLKVYLRDISKFPLLKAEEEREICKTIADLEIIAEEMQSKLEERRSKKLQTEYKELEERIITAKNKLIKSNLRLVVSIAKKYKNDSMHILDIINEGNIGLIEAIERFDYTKGYRFSTYGTWWIRQAIVKALADKGRIIRIPLHMLNTIKKCYQMSKKLTQKLGKNPSIEELSDFMKMSPAKINEIIRASFDTGSLETPLDDDNFTMLKEVIEDKDYNSESPLEKVFQLSLHDLIYKILDKLKEKEKVVVELRFGLRDGKTYTLEETGNILGITRERVRQIQEKALKKIQRFQVTKELKEFINKD